jgi:hypothetical protein
VSEIVFILGAGASAKAGAPLMWNFLDVAERLLRSGKAGTKNSLSEDYKLVFKAIAALQPVYAKGYLDLDNLEAVFAAFEMAALCGGFPESSGIDASKLGPALRRVITSTLEQEIFLPVQRPSPESIGRVLPPEPYGQFADVLAGLKDRASVITFNYDLCLDFACHSRGLPINYCLPADGTSGIDVMKLHGSLNWIRCEDQACPGVMPWRLPDYFQDHGWRDALITGAERVRLALIDGLAGFDPHGKGPCSEPFIVPPTWNKGQHHQGIAPVWAAAAEHLREAQQIVVCGYSLPDSDPFFRYLYALGTVGETRLKSFTVFDPDPSGGVEKRFRSLLGRAAERRFEMSKVVFELAVAHFKPRFGL